MRKRAMETGGNRTGIAVAPREARKTMEGAAEGEPNPRLEDEGLEKLRAAYIRESDPVGSMPAASKTPPLVRRVKNGHLTLLLDKLSERLAFERMGVRLYDALINKVWASHEPNAPDIKELAEIRDQELAHFVLLHQWIKKLGGDPTSESPCADVSGVASRGVMQVVADPRTSVAQSLNAVLTAELTDNAGWELLIDLAARVDLLDMVEEFHRPAADEQQHLVRIKSWLGADLANRVA